MSHYTGPGGTFIHFPHRSLLTPPTSFSLGRWRMVSAIWTKLETNIGHDYNLQSWMRTSIETTDCQTY